MCNSGLLDSGFFEWNVPIATEMWFCKMFRFQISRWTPDHHLDRRLYNPIDSRMRRRSHGDGSQFSVPCGTIKVPEHHPGDPVFKRPPNLIPHSLSPASFESVEIPLPKPYSSLSNNISLTGSSARSCAFSTFRLDFFDLE